MESLDTTNRQLVALNRFVQGQLNGLFKDVDEVIQEEKVLAKKGPGEVSPQRHAIFLQKLTETIHGLRTPS